MPATTCTNPIVFNLSKDDQKCRFIVELTWDGTSVPPSCQGVVSAVRWNNQSARPFYAHLPSSRVGPAVYQILPGDVGQVTTRAILHAAGLDDRSDVDVNLDLNEIPPQAGERLLNP